MKNSTMKTLAICCCLIFPNASCLAETEPPPIKTQEPKLYDHFVEMRLTQERLVQRSPEAQERLQLQIRRIELQACQRLMQDRHEGVREDAYRRQGGDEFVAYVLQFEQYCKTLR